ncbi:MAG: M23 family metallopeptidase, partial [Desulfocucumaceae bacterium]
KRSEFHDGIDIAAAYGSAIKAAGDGVVTFAAYKGSWGRLIIISHGYGYVSQYAHNSSLLVSVGDKVKKGEVIARLGNTGRSTGPHVHFSVAKNGNWIDPMDLLNAAKK